MIAFLTRRTGIRILRCWTWDEDAGSTALGCFKRLRVGMCTGPYQSAGRAAPMKLPSSYGANNPAPNSFDGPNMQNHSKCFNMCPLKIHATLQANSRRISRILRPKCRGLTPNGVEKALRGLIFGCMTSIPEWTVVGLSQCPSLVVISVLFYHFVCSNDHCSVGRLAGRSAKGADRTHTTKSAENSGFAARAAHGRVEVRRLQICKCMLYWMLVVHTKVWCQRISL